jgi:small basic protein
VVPAVFGLILRFMGAPQAHALIFCGASLALMALLGTRLPGQIQAVRRHLIDNWNKPE